MDTDLAAAYQRCRDLHKRHGRTYYLATRLLPAWKRRHVHALYGFTRYADEIVDRTEALPPAERAARLTHWSDRFFAGTTDDPFLKMFDEGVPRLAEAAWEVANMPAPS